MSRYVDPSERNHPWSVSVTSTPNARSKSNGSVPTPLTLERPGWYWDGNPDHKSHFLDRSGAPLCRSSLVLLDMRPVDTITSTDFCCKACQNKLLDR